MSKVPFTIDVDRYVCTELEDIRTMTKHLDFSGLPVSIERIQSHVNAMESGLWSQRDHIDEVRRIMKKDIKAKAKLTEIEELFVKYDKKRGK